MAGISGRPLPALLILALALALLLSGCVDQLQKYAGQAGTATPGTQATGAAADPYGSQLEALNGEIYAADSYAKIANLTARVASLESAITASGKYTDYLTLTQAQSRALQLANATLLHSDTAAAIAKSGIDCSKDYSGVTKTLKGMNYTRQVALSKAEAYVAKNPASTAKLLVTLINNTDTEGMYIFSTVVDEVYAYACPKAEKPSKSYTLPLSKDDAVELVVDEVVGSEGYYVYYPGKQLISGDVVSAKDRFGNVTRRTMKANTWFFMLDKEPESPWAHGVKFVFVDAASANYTVTDEVYNPRINGVDYWLTMGNRLNTAWIAYPKNASFGTNASLSPSRRNFIDGKLYFFGLGNTADIAAGTECSRIDCCKGVGKKRAVVVNGFDDTFFQTDTEGMYNFLKNAKGYGADEITYLNAKAGIRESDGISSLKTFEEALQKLANEAQCCDPVYIYVTSHGIEVKFYEFKNRATGEARWFPEYEATGLAPRTWRATSRFYTDHVIDMNPYREEAMPDGTKVPHGSRDGGDAYASGVARNLLDKMKSCYATVIWDSCHSGYAAPVLAGRGRTVMTTSDKGSSYVMKDQNLGSIWNYYFMLSFGLFSDEADANNDGTVTDAEAFNYANGETDAYAKKNLGKDQTGTWTNPAPPCVCCHVPCNESTKWLCSVVEADGKNSPLCKKVGDYCGPATENITTPNVTENITGGGEPPLTAGVCGDGVKVAPEECDKNDTQCPKYRYCDTKTCTCKQYPMICGDGHIAAGEECDPKATPIGCSEGKECRECVCRTTSATCGDGKKAGLEQCEAGVACQSGYTCNLNNCQCEASTTGGGTGGQNGTGGGTTTTEPYCGDGTVNGNEQCEGSSGCASGQYCSGCQCIATPAYCGDGTVNGNEQCDGSSSGCSSGGVCSGCTCVYPPNPNCESVCGQLSGAQYLGKFTDSNSCSQSLLASTFPAKNCYTTCRYATAPGYGNVAGTVYCCCGTVKYFACSDCPGQNPQCPSTSICTTNAPSWYHP